MEFVGEGGEEIVFGVGVGECEVVGLFYGVFGLFVVGDIDD